MEEKNKNISINYTNWRGETRDRNITPVEIWYGSNKKHTASQWFLKAIDIDKGEQRDFAMTSINKMNNYTINEAKKTDETPAIVSTDIKSVKLYTDGGSRGNPGPSAMGFVILDESDNEIKKDSRYLGITTNNQAEYQGLQEGLQACLKLGFREVAVHMDSLLVVNQMKGIYKVKNRDLWPVYEASKELAGKFKKITFTHVPRELNKIADGMVNECLDTRSD